jgi:hypothetical protein
MLSSICIAGIAVEVMCKYYSILGCDDGVDGVSDPKTGNLSSNLWTVTSTSTCEYSMSKTKLCHHPCKAKFSASVSSCLTAVHLCFMFEIIVKKPHFTSFCPEDGSDMLLRNIS